ncbi:MAG TPA: tetratricopeptide repeat protein [Kiritimatiellia bacterium]|nr:tetratricopeptide repeat protein [Kiritimatiellia bacterium]HPJ57725.1 tetratricopeptide repeat protein [Kiritimatiellia bacterium]HPR69232.1 tetratricopeptide repeat protein [Kiritimatiellia bacterium]HRX06518.1 tetratricopeptide repeat protein [Kiritimatiellia bacterium]
MATGIGLLLMLALLMMAVKYAQRDWSRKNQRARSLGVRHVEPKARDESPQPPAGREQEWSSRATARLVDRLGADSRIPNWWLVQSRGHPDRDHPQLVLQLLRMAMAVSGESAAMKNDFGAAWLQQNRVRAAATQFRSALQIEPGYAPALFNLALCAVAQRNPSEGSRQLARYLARRPDDTAAYRLQCTLLSQLGRPADALDLLERFLRDQPPEQPLFLEAALLAARLGQNGNALRYLETALSGNSIQSVVRAYQSPAFRSIRLSGAGDDLASRMATRARVAFSAPLPVEDISPLRAAPSAIVR